MMLVLSIASVYADVEIDGINYALDDVQKTAKVIQADYTGSISIPSQITYNEETFTVTSIGQSAFNDCIGLTSITIPESVTSIEKYAFDGCSGLSSITIFESVSNIGENALFYNDTVNVNVVVLNDTTFCNNVIIHRINYSCRDYYGGNNPNSLVNICLLDRDGNEIKEFVVPDGVTTIGNCAFENCVGLTSIIIPESVGSIEPLAFLCCDGLSTMTVKEGNPVYDSRDNCNAIIETATNTIVRGCKNTVIPSSVTSIGRHAFAYCNSLASITIPDGVTSIGYSAFYYCDNLTSIIIPDGVTDIGGSAFAECNNLVTITIPASVMNIGSQAFSKYNNQNAVDVNVVVRDFSAFCNNNVIGKVSFGKYRLVDTGGNEIKEFVIPEGTKSIRESAFSVCVGLTSITIPESVTSIGRAFGGCINLTSITVKQGNPVYDSRDNCNAIIETKTNTLIAGIKNTIIPTSVTSIGEYAFSGISGLTSITIPKSVTSISANAYIGCNLENIFANNPLTRIDGSFSDRTLQHAMVYVPVGTWGQAVYGGDWYKFNNIREVTTTSQSLSPSRAYTMMNAQNYGYAVYGDAQNEVDIVKAFYSFNESDPNNSWQIIDQPSGKSIMNIGSNKYLNVLADGKMTLSDSPVILNISDTDKGIAINGAEQEWMFVTNNNVPVKNPTKVETLKENTIAVGDYYSIDGVLLTEPKSGMNIIRTRDGRARKVLNDR